jgi:hypothetical protein
MDRPDCEIDLAYDPPRCKCGSSVEAEDGIVLCARTKEVLAGYDDSDKFDEPPIDYYP